MCHIILVDPRGPLVESTSMDPRTVLGTQLEDESDSYKDAMAFDNISHSDARVRKWSISHA